LLEPAEDPDYRAISVDELLVLALHRLGLGLIVDINGSRRRRHDSTSAGCSAPQTAARTVQPRSAANVAH
jgi:hypothetical protein